MDSEPNDLIVDLLSIIVNFLHILAGIALIILNYVAYQSFKEIIDTGELISYQVLFSVVALLVYVIAVGAISLFISINRNLQRLVFLQSGQVNDAANNTGPQVKVSVPLVKQKDPNLHPYEEGYHDD